MDIERAKAAIRTLTECRPGTKEKYEAMMAVNTFVNEVEALISHPNILNSLLEALQRAHDAYGPHVGVRLWDDGSGRMYSKGSDLLTFGDFPNNVIHVINAWCEAREQTQAERDAKDVAEIRQRCNGPCGALDRIADRLKKLTTH